MTDMLDALRIMWLAFLDDAALLVLILTAIVAVRCAVAHFGKE